MDEALRRQMLAYYDKRAPEYDEAYTRGTGTSSIRDPGVFVTEATLLSRIVATTVRGRVMDLACGTAYWLPQYGPRCEHVTLFDQSDRMLSEAKAKAHTLGLADRCSIELGDFFAHRFAERAFDSVLVGFFLSHLTEAQEGVLFETLRAMLRPGGRFLIMDSAWGPERAAVNAKVECQARRLNDGTAFQIYKRYCDREDLDRWPVAYGVTVQVEHFGRAFYAASGTFPSSVPATRDTLSA